MTSLPLCETVVPPPYQTDYNRQCGSSSLCLMVKWFSEPEVTYGQSEL